jgi:predicted glycoside hydrolase/deacetylase ChbG (UPF0249 family)
MHRAYAELPPDTSPEEIRAEFDAQLREVRRRGIEPTHVDSHMLASESGSEMEVRVRRVIEALCADEGLVYTYATRPDGSLVHFDSETLFSPLSTEQLYQRMSLLGDGIHHVIAHCALSSEEQESLCSPDMPGRAWALQYRVKDHAALTSEAMRAFLDRSGFEILSMPRFLELDRERRG